MGSAVGSGSEPAPASLSLFRRAGMSEDTSSAEEAGLTAAAVLGMVLSFVLAMGGGLAPFYFGGGAPSPAREKSMHRMNAFAGGVLMGAGFTHLLPDLVIAAVHLGLERSPTPYIFVLVGFLLPFVLENTPPRYWQRSLSLFCRHSPPPGMQALPQEEEREGGGEDWGKREGGGSGGGGEEDGGEDDADEEEDVAGGGGNGGKEGVAWLLVATLAVHSLLEGMGIGVQGELLASIGILAAVLAHKGFSAFALGMAFRGAGISVRAAAKGIGLLAAMTPLGILLGLLLRVEVHSPWVDVIAVGLSAGTFMYVGVEILTNECAATEKVHSASAVVPPENAPQSSEEDDQAPRFAFFFVGIAVFLVVGFVLASAEQER